VALRLVSRIFVAGKVTLSDYVMVVGWALVLGLSVAIFYATANGAGVRVGLTLEQRQRLAKAEYAFTVLYVGRPSIRTVCRELTDQTVESCVDGHQIVHSHLLPHSQ